jgi:hypothetical protein
VSAQICVPNPLATSAPIVSTSGREIAVATPASRALVGHHRERGFQGDADGLIGQVTLNTTPTARYELLPLSVPELVVVAAPPRSFART